MVQKNDYRPQNFFISSICIETRNILFFRYVVHKVSLTKLNDFDFQQTVQDKEKVFPPSFYTCKA